MSIPLTCSCAKSSFCFIPWRLRASSTRTPIVFRSPRSCVRSRTSVISSPQPFENNKTRRFAGRQPAPFYAGTARQFPAPSPAFAQPISDSDGKIERKIKTDFLLVYRIFLHGCNRGPLFSANVFPLGIVLFSRFCYNRVQPRNRVRQGSLSLVYVAGGAESDFKFLQWRQGYEKRANNELNPC